MNLGVSSLAINFGMRLRTQFQANETSSASARSISTNKVPNRRRLPTVMKMHVPTDSFGGMSPEVVSSNLLKKLCTLASIEIIKLQEDSASSGVGEKEEAEQAETNYTRLNSFIEEVPFKNDELWLKEVLSRKDDELNKATMQMLSIRSNWQEEGFDYNIMKEMVLAGLEEQKVDLMQTYLMKSFTTAAPENEEEELQRRDAQLAQLAAEEAREKMEQGKTAEKLAELFGETTASSQGQEANAKDEDAVNNALEAVKEKDVVEDAVEDLVEDTVEDVVEDVVEDAVEDVVEDAVEDVVENVVEDAVEDVVENGVEDGVEDVVEDVAEDVVQDAVEEVVEDGATDVTAEKKEEEEEIEESAADQEEVESTEVKEIKDIASANEDDLGERVEKVSAEDMVTKGKWTSAESKTGDKEPMSEDLKEREEAFRRLMELTGSKMWKKYGSTSDLFGDEQSPSKKEEDDGTTENDPNFDI